MKYSHETLPFNLSRVVAEAAKVITPTDRKKLKTACVKIAGFNLEVEKASPKAQKAELDKLNARVELGGGEVSLKDLQEKATELISAKAKEKVTRTWAKRETAKVQAEVTVPIAQKIAAKVSETFSAFVGRWLELHKEASDLFAEPGCQLHAEERVKRTQIIIDEWKALADSPTGALHVLWKHFGVVDHRLNPFHPEHELLSKEKAA